MKKCLTIFALMLALVGCGDDDSMTDGGTEDASTQDATAGGATINFLLEAEDSITDGVAAGTGDEDIQDGWAATFTKYIIAVGHIELTADGVDADDDRVFLVDLVQAPPAGFDLWSVSSLAEGRYDVTYELAEANAESMVHESVTEADATEMRNGNLSYLIEGSITKDDQTISFRWGVSAETVYGPCGAEEGAPGVAVSGATATSAALSIHGDHIFFNGFPEGEEGGVMRLAQWLADSDTDSDGTVTQAELEALSPSDLSELDERYSLTGGPIDPLTNMWEYVTAQLKTQGHFQGEGECAVDGVEHNHGEEDHDHD